MNKIDDILDEMNDVIDKAKPFPFAGNKYIANTDRLRELIDDARLHLPSEIKEARNVVFDKNRILNEAKEKAEAIINQAEKRAASIVSQDAIVKEATKKAYDILTKAKTAANQMKKEASEYTDSLMNKTERFMTAVLQDVRKTKSELRDKR